MACPGPANEKEKKELTKKQAQDEEEGKSIASESVEWEAAEKQRWVGGEQPLNRCLNPKRERGGGSPVRG